VYGAISVMSMCPSTSYTPFLECVIQLSSIIAMITIFVMYVLLKLLVVLFVELKLDAFDSSNYNR
jgi:hypothetical protein